MNHYSYMTHYEENGNFRLTKEECGVFWKEEIGVVTAEGGRTPSRRHVSALYLPCA
ncbi:MAG: hypothetical protein ACLVAW_11805 [Eisenbergiella massiliensis]